MFDLAAAPANLSFTLSVLNEAETVEIFKQYSAHEGYRIIFSSVWILGGRLD